MKEVSDGLFSTQTSTDTGTHIIHSECWITHSLLLAITLCCVCFYDDYAPILLLSPSLSLFSSLILSNLCVVVGAGADRPRDGI